MDNVRLDDLIQGLGFWITDAVEDGDEVALRITAKEEILGALGANRAAKNITVVYSGNDPENLIGVMNSYGIGIVIVRGADQVSAPAFDYAGEEAPPPPYEEPANLQYALEISPRLPGGVARIPQEPGANADARNWVDPVPGAAPQANPDAQLFPPPANENRQHDFLLAREPRALVKERLGRLPENKVLHILGHGTKHEINKHFDKLSRLPPSDVVKTVKLEGPRLELYNLAIMGPGDVLGCYVGRLLTWPDFGPDHRLEVLRPLFDMSENVPPIFRNAYAGTLVLGILQSDMPPDEKSALLRAFGGNTDLPGDLIKVLTKPPFKKIMPPTPGDLAMAKAIKLEAEKMRDVQRLLGNEVALVQPSQGQKAQLKGANLMAERVLPGKMMLCTANRAIPSLQAYARPAGDPRFYYQVPINDLKVPSRFF